MGENSSRDSHPCGTARRHPRGAARVRGGPTSIPGGGRADGGRRGGPVGGIAAADRRGLPRRGAHRRSARARPARRDDPRRGGPRDRPRGAARRGDPARRRARRAGLRGGPGHHRLHPAAPGPRRARHRADGGVDPVRRDERLRLRAGLGFGAREPVGGERDAPRHQPVAAERHVHGLLRHLLRPAQRLQLLHQPARGAIRLAVHQRGQPEQRLEPGLGRAHGPFRRRLDGGDGDPVQDAALPVGAAAHLGHPAPARHPPQERVGLPDAAAHLGRRRQRRRRHLSSVGGRIRSSVSSRRRRAATSRSSPTRSAG